MNAPQRVAVLGSTGSIGLNTLDVLSRHPDRFTVTALAANSNLERLREQCLTFKPLFAVMADVTAAAQLAADLRAAGAGTSWLSTRWMPSWPPSWARRASGPRLRRRKRASESCWRTRKRW
jgi:NAD(P)-dependent dehydrogenase (short-subunit alcohol dehydrogenase family)